jgi:hypothetical protein
LGDVEDVVDHLECQAERVAELGEGLKFGGTGIGAHRAEAQGAGEQGGGFRLVDANEVTPGEFFSFSLEIHDLAADEFRLVDGKTGPRSCPFLPACKTWLEAQPRRDGPAWITPPPTIRSQGKASPEYGLHAAMRELFELAGVAKITNGARHSFITFRCAETRNEARVADECGNSAAMVKKHYRNVTTAAAAKKYFAIRPATSADNVIPMTATPDDAAPAKLQPRRKAR